MLASNIIPYCGSPPVPGSLSWNLDPALLLVFACAAVVYAAGAGKCPQIAARQRRYFGIGLALALFAFISPLCNLSIALFSARVGQHMVLTLVASPLIVLGRPELALVALARGQRAHWLQPFGGPRLIAVGTASFALFLWLWHMPAPYGATLESNFVYWLMHCTLFGSALLLWHGLLVEGDEAPGTSMMGAFLTGLNMSLLGAVLTFASRPFFEFHAATTWPWGLSQLEDQQLGGLLMWVPGGLLLTAYAMIAFAAWLNRFPPEVHPSRRVG